MQGELYVLISSLERSRTPTKVLQQTTPRFILSRDN